MSTRMRASSTLRPSRAARRLASRWRSASARRSLRRRTSVSAAAPAPATRARASAVAASSSPGPLLGGLGPLAGVVELAAQVGVLRAGGLELLADAVDLLLGGRALLGELFLQPPLGLLTLRVERGGLIEVLARQFDHPGPPGRAGQIGCRRDQHGLGGRRHRLLGERGDELGPGLGERLGDQFAELLVVLELGRDGSRPQAGALARLEPGDGAQRRRHAPRRASSPAPEPPVRRRVFAPARAGDETGPLRLNSSLLLSSCPGRSFKGTALRVHYITFSDANREQVGHEPLVS